VADRAKLLAELTGSSAAAYAAAVDGGSNTELLALLATPHASAKAARSIPAPEVRAAIAPALKGLDALKLQRLSVLLAAGDVSLEETATVAELKDILSGDSSVLDALSALAERPQTVAEATCDGPVTLEDLWAVLPQIPTSLHARYLAGKV